MVDLAGALSVAIFGGTFDPIHNAHLTIARAAADQCGLNRVLFVPASRPPHKSTGAHASYEHRFGMVEIACRDDARFEPSRLEEGAAYSYSISTIEKLRASTGPEARLFFLIGADAFADIRTWHRWQDVVREVEFIVAGRPRASYQAPGHARVHTLPGLDLAISSSEIRRKLREGDEAVEVPDAVLAYIRQHGLYVE